MVEYTVSYHPRGIKAQRVRPKWVVVGESGGGFRGVSLASPGQTLALCTSIRSHVLAAVHHLPSASASTIIDVSHQDVTCLCFDLGESLFWTAVLGSFAMDSLNDGFARMQSMGIVCIFCFSNVCDFCIVCFNNVGVSLYNFKLYIGITWS